MLERLLDFEDPLERLDPDEVARAGDELLEPELDLVTLGVLFDPRFPEDVERVTDCVLASEPDLVTLVVLVRDDVFGALEDVEDVYPEPDLFPLERTVLYVPFVSVLLFLSFIFD